MTSPMNALDQLRIASPCKASWDEMQGTDRVRFCSLCSLNVYDVSAMARDEAEALIRAKEGRLCVRLYRRADGTVLTRDCPKGIRAVPYLVAKAAAAVLAMVLSVAAGCHKPERVTTGAVAISPDPPVEQLQPTMGETRPESR